MNFNIREAIKDNLNDADKNNLRDTIVEAIQDGQEKMLPGLGVLFEVIWQQSDESERNAMIQHLESGLPNA